MKIFSFALLALAIDSATPGVVDAVSFPHLRSSVVSNVPSTMSSSSSSTAKKYLQPTSSFHQYDSAVAFDASSIPRGGANVGPITAENSFNALTILTIIQGMLFIIVPRKSLDMYGCPSKFNDNTTQTETQKFGTLVSLMGLTAHCTLSKRMTLEQANHIISFFSILHFFRMVVNGQFSQVGLDQLYKEVTVIFTSVLPWVLLVTAGLIGISVVPTGVIMISWHNRFEHAILFVTGAMQGLELYYIVLLLISVEKKTFPPKGFGELWKAEKQNRYNPICQILDDQLTWFAGLTMALNISLNLVEAKTMTPMMAVGLNSFVYMLIFAYNVLSGKFKELGMQERPHFFWCALHAIVAYAALV
mmetsp:Transcript_61532/g.150616  ORF Transcript_61532/g.150616 Transcript_61532/m.150616 type:complete len:360 (-) Transcript_61532:1204-2283(-)